MKLAVVFALLALAVSSHAARSLKAAAGTPDQLAAKDPSLSSVLNIIKALGVLPGGNMDSGITIFTPNNDAVKKLFDALSQAVPTDYETMAAFVDKLGPIKNMLISAILYNISPSANTDANGKTTLTTGGNSKPVNVVDAYEWNGALIVVTDEVLQPAPLPAIKPTSAADATAAIAALSASLSPAGAPAAAPAAAPAPSAEPSETPDLHIAQGLPSRVQHTNPMPSL
eukprot:scaffold14.g1056.t1